MSIKVVVAEDMPAIQKKIVKSLQSSPDINVVGVAKNGYEAILQVTLNRPDVLLTDLEMESKRDGLKAITQLLTEFPTLKIVILTVHEEDDLIFEAFQLGVTDYILKNSSGEDIVSRIKAAYEDKAEISPEIANKIKNEFKRIRTAEQSFLYWLHLMSQLTPMELNIIKLLQQGKSRTEVCDINSIELSTLKTHINNILKKTQKANMKEVLEDLKALNIFN